MAVTKPKNLTKKTLPPPPIGWREPFDDQRSPFRISFSDDDPDREGMKFIRIRKVDGSLTEYIVEETLADALSGKPSAEMIASCREHLECGEHMSDAKVAVE